MATKVSITKLKETKTIGGKKYTQYKHYDTKPKAMKDVKAIQQKGGKTSLVESPVYTIYYRFEGR